MSTTNFVHLCKPTDSKFVPIDGECECHLLQNFVINNHQDASEDIINVSSCGGRSLIEGQHLLISDYICFSSAGISKRGKIKYKSESVPTNITKKKSSDSASDSDSCQHVTCYSWDEVLQWKNNIEAKTQARYTHYSKTKGFNDARPSINRKVRFTMKCLKRNSVIIPFLGVPFIWIGTRTFLCHLGKNPNGKKGKVGDGSTAASVRHRLPSKKICCPAAFTVAKIAIFPDFKINGKNELVDADLAKINSMVQNQWRTANDDVNFKIEYHIKLPTIEDHKGHKYLESIKGCIKYNEPLDPRICDFIKELIHKDDTVSAMEVLNNVVKFVKCELLHEELNQNLERRRYNPNLTDVQNFMKKAKIDLMKRMPQVTSAKIQCISVLDQIEQLIPELEPDRQKQLRKRLYHIFKMVQAGGKFEPIADLYEFVYEEDHSDVVKLELTDPDFLST